MLNTLRFSLEIVWNERIPVESQSVVDLVDFYISLPTPSRRLIVKLLQRKRTFELPVTLEDSSLHLCSHLEIIYNFS